jgi:hypothetical protein
MVTSWSKPSVSVGDTSPVTGQIVPAPPDVVMSPVTLTNIDVGVEEGTTLSDRKRGQGSPIYG